MEGRWPFVGRSKELARIIELLSAGVGVAVVGAAGSGKTALLRELAARLADLGEAVVLVIGTPGGDAVPLQPFATLLAGDRSQDPILGPAERVAASLRDRVVPGLDGAGRAPVLVVDDAHLLDAASAQLVRGLASAEEARLIVALRPNEVAEPAVARLWVDDGFRRVEVQPLVGADVQQVLETALAGTVDPHTSSTFDRFAQGNALLLRELVLDSLDAEKLVLEHGVWRLVGSPPVGAGAGELIEARFDGLPEVQRNGVEMVGVGEPLPLLVAESVVGGWVLEDLEALHLIAVEESLDGAEVRMAHPLYGEVLRARLPVLRRRRLRLELARALEKPEHPRPVDLVRAALWRLESSEIDDPERLLDAAKVARAFSLDTAERLARAAVAAKGPVESVVLLASIVTMAGRSEEAAQLLDGLPPVELSQLDREAVLYTQAIGQGLLRGDPAGGATMLAAVAESGPLRGMHSALLLLDGHVREAVGVGQSVLDDAAAGLTARSVAAIGVVGGQFWAGRPRAAYDTYLQVLPMLLQAPEIVHARGQIQVNAFPALAEYGELDRAEADAAAEYERATVADDGWERSRWAYALARVQLLRGQARRATELMRVTVATPAPFDRSFLAYNLSYLARAAAAAGFVEEARAALTAAPSDVPRFPLFEAEVELAEAAVLAAEGLLGAAIERAAWSAELAAGRGLWTVAGVAAHHAARWGGAVLVSDHAAEATDRCESLLGDVAGAHVAALGAADADALDTVSARFEKLGALLYAGEAASAAAVAHRGAGSGRLAAAASVRAEELLARCEGAATPWLAGNSSVTPLTRREREVAVLAAAGRADAAIAAELALSVRTVQTHLTRVYAKLGVHRRDDLGDALL